MTKACHLHSFTKEARPKSVLVVEGRSMLGISGCLAIILIGDPNDNVRTFDTILF